MSQKKNIVIPSGNEVWDYINRGYAICNKCGAVMEEGDDYTYNCPNCGWNVDQDEYVYDDGDPEPRVFGLFFFLRRMYNAYDEKKRRYG